MSHDQGFPRVSLPAFEPDDGLSFEKPAVVLRGELDAAYRAINALVRKYAPDGAVLDPKQVQREDPVVAVQHMKAVSGFMITVRPLR